MDEFEDDDDLLSAVKLDFPVTMESAESLSKSNDLNQKETDYVDEDSYTPEVFPFPFEAYDIQKDFMKELYKCLNNSKIGIFESPTGTGKSLSLICGCLKWLKDFRDKQQKELEALTSGVDSNGNSQDKPSSNEELDWITEFTKKKEKEEKLKKVQEEQEKIARREAKLTERGAGTYQLKRKRVKMEDEFEDLMKDASVDIKAAFDAEMESLKKEYQGADVNPEDSHLMLEEYFSDEEADGGRKEEDLDEEDHVTKIYFCSRTHSQLSQFVREVIKSPYGDDTRVISLGSRQNLCINDAVRRLKSLSLINETCLDMQKKGKKSSGEAANQKRSKMMTGCPYYKQDVLHDFKDSLLLDVRDIEQLVTVGKQMKACPYYGTRYAIPAADIVALPYNTLLHKATREACGIKLKDNIVVIDEAHNLLETINNVYSVEVTGAQTLRAHSQLSQYECKYKSRLKAKNLMYVKQILFVLAAIVKCLGGNVDESSEKQTITKPETQLKTINNFLFISKLDNMNLFKILRYCERSQISKKLHGFVEKYADSPVVPTKKETSRSGVTKFLDELNIKPEVSSDTTEKSPIVSRENPMSSPLMHIESFLQALTNADKDGRIVINKQGLLSQSSLKFLLLNPAVHFSSVLQEVRSLIVAGGTMQPISEFTDQLFQSADVHPSRVTIYSCGHVIPADHILPLTISTGPSGMEMDFTYQSRDSPTLMEELGRILVNISNVTPGGIVCFFPSYDYEHQVYNHWEKTGYLNRLSNRKKIFREPRKSGVVEEILSEYSTVIKRCKQIGSSTSQTGAVLFCVVGGKMSEGINFSDDLGRCVVMIGLPYPNLRSAELKEKMDYLNSNYPKDGEGRLPGQVHYENLCMKAVNQSIGRAIRHRGDYASMLLVDRRYNRNNVTSKLPTWIGQHLQKPNKFGVALGLISKFFAHKRDYPP